MEAKRKFGPSIWALQNKNVIFLLFFIIVFFGFHSYLTLPKELFPEINYPTIFVQTVYPGNSAKDIEKLITEPLEKELKGLDKVKSIKSTSAQDISVIYVEFEADVKVKSVLDDVKDAVDRAKINLPSDLKSDPRVIELDFSNLPFITLNFSGDFNINELKKYADIVKDEVEKVPQVSKVNVRGISQKEIQVNVNYEKMYSLGINFTQIENALKFENFTATIGDFKFNNTRKPIRIIGEFTDLEQIKKTVIKSDNQKVVYLSDIAEVVEKYSDPTSYARYFDKPVVSLLVIKKNRENLLEAVDNVLKKVDELKNTGKLPKNLEIIITNNQSRSIKNMLGNLESNIISGIIIVVLTLLLFLGLRNSLIVGMSIPMSMFMTFIYMKLTNTTVNFMTLFSLVLALGMLVDNAIVVVEVITRKVEEGMTPKEAARDGVSEVAIPIITSTATTLGAFVPLLFWKDVVGQFMKLLPLTLIVVLTASLINALLIVPVFSEKFIKPIHLIKRPDSKKIIKISIYLLPVAIVLYLTKVYWLANLLVLSVFLISLYAFVLFDLADWFQEKFLPIIENFYEKFIDISLRGRNPYYLIGGFLVFFVFVFYWYFGIVKPKIDFFPVNQPQYINVFAELPIDADINYTDSVFKSIYNDVNTFLEPYKHIVESELITVGEGVAKMRSINIFKTYNKAQIFISFVDYEKRKNYNTSEIYKNLYAYLQNRYPGINIYMEKNEQKPPTGSPVSIEIKGDDIDTLINIAYRIMNIVEKANIKGIEKLNLDVITNKPEIQLYIDKENANLNGVTTAQILQTLRTALFGSEVIKFKSGTDQLPVIIRLDEVSRNDFNKLLNLTIPARNNMGQIVNIPIYNFVTIKQNLTLDAVKHIDTKRAINITSNVVEGYNANLINKKIKQLLKNFELPEGYSIEFTGEQKSMQQTEQFLGTTMLIAVSLILLILVLQFNSFVKPLIILFTVILAFVGVFGGYATFNMNFVVMMTGIGLISLAGIVVNNAIVLVDYVDFLKAQRKLQLGISPDDNLPISETIKALETAGKVRLRPVLLTSITTILGLITMAIGLNLDYIKLFTEFKPNIYFGGDSAGYWSPLAWSVIFGLFFATFITLVILPSLYLIANRVKLRFVDKSKLNV